jgi:hypothetical protein
MTLDEAMQYDEFYALIPFQGYKKVGKLTGKYYYQSIPEKESFLQVEVKTGWFTKRYFALDLLKPIKHVRDL